MNILKTSLLTAFILMTGSFAFAQPVDTTCVANNTYNTETECEDSLGGDTACTKEKSGKWVPISCFPNMEQQFTQ